MARSIPALDLWHPWALEASGAIDLATRCEAEALDSDARITNSEGASVSSHEGSRVYGNSHGFLEGYRDTHHSLSCAVLASRGSEMERDFEYTHARNPDELDSPVGVGREAARRALAGSARGRSTRARRQCCTRRASPAASSAISSAPSAAAALYRKSSFLLDSLGTPVLPTA